MKILNDVEINQISGGLTRLETILLASSLCTFLGSVIGALTLGTGAKGDYSQMGNFIGGMVGAIGGAAAGCCAGIIGAGAYILASR